MSHAAVPRTGAFRWGVILAAASVPALIMGPTAIGITTGLAIVLLLLAMPARRWWPGAVRAARSPWGIVFGVVVLSWLPSLFGSLDPQLSLEGLTGTVGFVAAGVLIWAILVEYPCSVPLVRHTLLASSAVAALVGCAALYGTPEILAFVRFDGWVETDALGRLRAFANAAMLLVPAVLWAGWTGGGAARAAGTGGAVVLLALILGTDVRAPFAGMLASAAFAVLAVLARARPPLALAASLMLGAGAILALITLALVEIPPVEGVPFAPYLPPALFDLHRQVIWSFTLDQALAHPLRGVGINAVNLVPGSGALIPGLGPHGHYLPSHPHNWPLEIFAETGLIGMTTFLVFVGALMVTLGRDYMQSGSATSLAAGAVSAGYWSAGLFNFSFWEAWWQLSHVLLLALLLSARAAERGRAPLSYERSPPPVTDRPVTGC